MPIDKCGVFWVKTIHLYGGFNRKVSSYGNFIKVSVRNNKVNSPLQKKTKTKGIIIRTKKLLKKRDNSYIKFTTNGCVLLKKRTTPFGKRLFGPIPFGLKRRKLSSSFSGII